MNQPDSILSAEEFGEQIDVLWTDWHDRIMRAKLVIAIKARDEAVRNAALEEAALFAGNHSHLGACIDGTPRRIDDAIRDLRNT